MTADGWHHIAVGSTHHLLVQILTAALNAKLPEGVELASPWTSGNNCIIDLVYFKTFTFGGHEFAGAAFPDMRFNLFQEKDEQVQMRLLERTQAGEEEPSDIATWFKQQKFSFKRDYFLRTAMTLREFGVRPDPAKMLMGSHGSPVFRHMFARLMHLVATGKLADEDAMVDLFQSTPEDFEQVEGVIVGSEAGTQLGSMASICLPTGSEPGDYVILITDQRYIINGNQSRPSEADLQTTGPIGSRLQQVMDGIVSQHVRQTFEHLIEACSDHAYKVIALIRLLKAFGTGVELEHVDILEHTILKEVLRRGQQRSRLTAERQQHENRIQHQYKNFLHQIERKLWHPRDLTKRQMIKNAVSGRLTAWLWCSLVLTGTHTFGQ